MADPCLSLIGTSPNDEHGSNLLGRMETFVDGLIKQCRRYGLAAELILVEWNPPSACLPPYAAGCHT